MDETLSKSLQNPQQQIPTSYKKVDISSINSNMNLTKVSKKETAPRTPSGDSFELEHKKNNQAATIDYTTRQPPVESTADMFARQALQDPTSSRSSSIFDHFPSTPSNQGDF